MYWVRIREETIESNGNQAIREEATKGENKPYGVIE